MKILKTDLLRFNLHATSLPVLSITLNGVRVVFLTCQSVPLQGIQTTLDILIHSLREI